MHGIIIMRISLIQAERKQREESSLSIRIVLPGCAGILKESVVAVCAGKLAGVLVSMKECPSCRVFDARI